MTTGAAPRANLITAAAHAQETESRNIVVEAEELPSAYGAPPDLSRGRVSTLTKSYVLPPYSFEPESSYEGVLFRHGEPGHLFGQEIEMGLPHRFTIGLQNEVQHFDGSTSERSLGVEARYALANWGKLPLNPTISAEYRIGFGGGRTIQSISRCSCHATLAAWSSGP